MRARMNAAHGSSGAYVGGTGTVPNVTGTGLENPYRKGRRLAFDMDPTTGFVLALLVVELLALAGLRRLFRNAHGG